MSMLADLGTEAGITRENRLTSHAARASPAAPPAIDSNKLSVNDWRSKRAEVAPNEERMVSSLSRPMALPSSRFATFKQAINRTKPTAPSSNHSIARDARAMRSVTGATCASRVIPTTRWEGGIFSKMRCVVAFASACAWAMVTPGLRRATTTKL
jgi:hypothetical protein